MNKIKKSKQELEKEAEELRADIKKLKENEPDFGDDVDQFEEEADEANAYSTNLGKIEAFKRRLEEIEDELGHHEA